MQTLASWTDGRVTHQLNLRLSKTACGVKALTKMVGNKKKSGRPKLRTLKDSKPRAVTCVLCLGDLFTGTGDDLWR